MTTETRETLNGGDVEEKTLQNVHGRETKHEDFEVKEVIPVPCFVIKTKDEAGKKTFINVCGCAEIPVPGDWKGGKIPKDVSAALKSHSSNGEENEALRFPLSLGEARQDVDRQAKDCLVFDCLFNLDVIVAARLHRRLKVFLVGLAIEWTSFKSGLKLSSEYKLPKMHYKGNEIQKHRIKIKKGPMVQEINSVPSTEQSSKKKKDFETNHKERLQTDVNARMKLKSVLSFEGRPFERMIVEIEIPSHMGSQIPRVWLSGFTLNVKMSDSAELLTTELPFAVEREKVQVLYQRDLKRMRVTLPFKPIRTYLNETRDPGAEKNVKMKIA